MRSVNGTSSSTCYRVKDDNREEFQRRFPAAWAHYQAVKAGKRVEPERAGLSRPELLPRARISNLILQGYGTVERLAATSDTEAIQ